MEEKNPLQKIYKKITMKFSLCSTEKFFRVMSSSPGRHNLEIQEINDSNYHLHLTNHFLRI